MADPQAWYGNLEPVTKVWLTFAVVSGFLTAPNLGAWISPASLLLDWNAIFSRFEVRLVAKDRQNSGLEGSNERHVVWPRNSERTLAVAATSLAASHSDAIAAATMRIDADLAPRHGCGLLWPTLVFLANANGNAVSAARPLQHRVTNGLSRRKDEIATGPFL